jgi:hypothetical protein
MSNSDPNYYILVSLLLAGPFGGLLYSLRQPEIVLPNRASDGKFNPGIISDLAFGLAGAFVIFLLIPGQVPQDPWMIPKIFALGTVGGYGGRAIIDTYLSDKIQELRKEVTKETSNLREQIVRADEIDGRALLLTNQHLERNPGSPVDEAEMREAILKASPAIAVQIFEAARRARRNNRSDQELLRRVATVLRALIERKDQKSHRPYAQLAYILDNVEPPQTRESLDLINRAIEIRTQINDRGYPRYDLHRASCVIDLDTNFANRRKSDLETRNSVVDDLIRGLALEEAKQMLREAVAQAAKPTPVEQTQARLEKYSKLARWLHLNEVTLDDLHVESKQLSGAA